MQSQIDMSLIDMSLIHSAIDQHKGLAKSIVNWLHRSVSHTFILLPLPGMALKGSKKGLLHSMVFPDNFSTFTVFSDLKKSLKSLHEGMVSAHIIKCMRPLWAHKCPHIQNEIGGIGEELVLF